jgi:Pyruvate/2-oxoacid:ferredoxin oxidoreductase delta subunit
MIYYFSGTGNSEWVARELARLTGDDVMRIPATGKTEPLRVGPHERAGVVFPVYAWAVPDCVTHFVRGGQYAKDAYLYAVCTCGDSCGNTLGALRKHFPFAMGCALRMPNNYIPLFDADDPPLVREKVRAAKAPPARIADAVNADRAPSREASAADRLKTALVKPLFTLLMRRTGPFHATDACSGCGLCEKLCPLRNIRMVENRPVWGKNCTQCTACLNRCPQAAAQYGKSTYVRERYTFERNAQSYVD